jgi:hypothetical protein
VRTAWGLGFSTRARKGAATTAFANLFAAFTSRDFDAVGPEQRESLGTAAVNAAHLLYGKSFTMAIAKEQAPALIRALVDAAHGAGPGVADDIAARAAAAISAVRAVGQFGFTTASKAEARRVAAQSAASAAGAAGDAGGDEVPADDGEDATDEGEDEAEDDAAE